MQSSPNMSTCEEQGKVGEKTDRSGFKLQSLMWMWCSQDLALKKKKKDNQTNRIKLQPPLIPFYSRYLCVCVICAYVCAPVRIHVCFCTCVFFCFFLKSRSGVFVCAFRFERRRVDWGIQQLPPFFRMNKLLLWQASVSPCICVLYMCVCVCVCVCVLC